MDDTDLGGLDLEGAKAYLFEFATSAKLARKELESVEADILTWTKRIALATEKAMADLAAAAEAKLAELKAKREGIAGEVADIEAKVRRIREKLPGIAARERSIDPDRLLAELQLLTGELLGEGAPGLEAAMAKLEGEAKLESDLAALKAKEGGSPS